MYTCTFECLALSLPNANFKGNFYLEQKRLRSKRVTYEECPDPELDKFRTRRRRRKQKKSPEMVLDDSSSSSSGLEILD
ncbi:hypothetical protein AVEN_152535-1 [Araneus ventricosus]|uniref:Uncharacterized protein n=1 Tax=Araneus ventricosus TaxID=182803 RepID=A0A4Y2TFJ4_ARAVE|nr:hypothetical protein AVEN_152535-1 [Araneus ventricosus]